MLICISECEERFGKKKTDKTEKKRRKGKNGKKGK
jgi:hypothetical protein